VKKVLLVDDVRLTLDLGRTFFARAGCEVATASNGAEALAAYRRERPALVVVDLEMPGMPGDEVCREIKKDRKGAAVPVIIVVPRSSAQSVDRCARAGADAIIGKPIDSRELLTAAARLMGVKPRLNERVAVVVRVTTPEESYSIRGSTVDISVSGILLETDGSLAVGQVARFSLSLPGAEKPLEAMGEVARAGERAGTANRYGVRFILLMADVRQRLERFVSAERERGAERVSPGDR
jgi:CheY-like chemotaxis protein